MSDGISTNNETGAAEMFYTGERPWHGLGQELPEVATSEEAIKAAGLDWQIDKTKLVLEGCDMQVADKMATVRLNTDGTPRTILGVVGKGYVPFQNIEAFDFFDSVVGDKMAIYHTAGALNSGRRVWMLAKLPKDIIVKGKDLVEEFVLLTMAHDGSGAIVMMPTPVRAVCQNTVRAALAGMNERIFIRHTKNAKLKVDQAREAIGVTLKNYDIIEQKINAFASVNLNGQMFIGFLNNVFPVREEATDITKKHNDEIKDQVSLLFDKGKGNDIPEVKHTLWTAYNAVVEYGDYHKRVRKDDKERRLDSIWFGSSADLKEHAWRVADKMLV